MYAIEALPIHPQPQPLETLTSYITRLAHANGFRFIHGLRYLLDIRYSLGTWHDLPPKSFGLLPQAAHCSEARLLETTVYHLGRKFGRTRLSAFTKFMAGTLADRRRYCPHCLTETGYDRLPWRFSDILGCVDHHCLLLEACPYCHHQLPVFASPLNSFTCRCCGYDLREAQAPPLLDIEANLRRWDELVYLLTPQLWELQQPRIINIARQVLGFMRMQRGILSRETAEYLNIKKSSFIMLEHDRGRIGGDMFLYYQRYAQFLGVSFEALFEQAAVDVYKGKLERFEDARLAMVEQIIHDLREAGIRVTQRRVGERLGVEPNVLRGMPRVHACLRQAALERDGKTAQHEQALLDHIEAIIQRFRAHGRPTSVRAIAAELNVQESFFNPFPHVLARLRMLLQENQREKQAYADSLLQKTQQVVERMRQENHPLSAKAVAQQLNMTDSNLKNYPAIRAYLKTIIPSPQVQRQQREAILVERVQTAIAQLRTEGKFPTRKAITAMTGVSRSDFDYYPRLKAIRVQLLHSRGPAHEAYLLEKVRLAVQELRAAGLPVVRPLLEEKVGLAYGTLKYYPRIHRFWRESLGLPTVRPIKR